MARIVDDTKLLARLATVLDWQPCRNDDEFWRRKDRGRVHVTDLPSVIHDDVCALANRLSKPQNAEDLSDGDFDHYESLDAEERLRILAKHYQAARGGHRQFFEGRILEVTTDMDEHPIWFGELELPCACVECCSNA